MKEEQLIKLIEQNQEIIELLSITNTTLWLLGITICIIGIVLIWK